MHKINSAFIFLLGILIIFSIIFYNLYFNNTDTRVNYSYGGVKLIPENAPPLRNLFEKKTDSHNVFISSSECLKCHGMGMKIKERVQAPQIAHNILEYCVSCHALAKNGK